MCADVLPGQFVLNTSTVYLMLCNVLFWECLGDVPFMIPSITEILKYLKLRELVCL